VAGIITAFIDSEFRSASVMAQDALSAMNNGNIANARECIRRARLCFVTAMLHLHEGRDHNAVHIPEADVLDDRLREIEQMIEQLTY
jgi:hypothetical protein